MKKINLFLLIMTFVIISNGQEKTKNDRSFTIKLPLSSFVGDMFGESSGFGLGLEKMIKPSFSFSQEISYIFHVNNKSFFREDLESINGLKLTTEVRKYLRKEEIPESGFFVNTEMKNIFTKSTQELSMSESGL